MALSSEQLAELHDELINDPKQLGYDGKDDPTCAELLNTIGLSGEQLPNQSVPVTVVRYKVNVAEFEALTLGKQLLWNNIISTEAAIDISNTDLITMILTIFTELDSPLTWAALVALATRDCSRAEALFGDGVSVDYMDVGRARTGDY